MYCIHAQQRSGWVCLSKGQNCSRLWRSVLSIMFCNLHGKSMCYFYCRSLLYCNYDPFCHIQFFTMELFSFCSFIHWLTGKLLKLPGWRQCMCYSCYIQLLWVWVCACLFESLTDAGGHRWAALLVALGATVAGDAGDTVLAGALACGLVARLACGAHRVAVTGWGGGQGQVWRGGEGCCMR